jgi:hypothetical protein
VDEIATHGGMTTTLSPLKQFKSGILSTDVECNDGFLLTFKADNDYPACVKLDTKIQLLKRGWAMPGPKDFGYNPGEVLLHFTIHPQMVWTIRLPTWKLPYWHMAANYRAAILRKKII